MFYSFHEFPKRGKPDKLPVQVPFCSYLTENREFYNFITEAQEFFWMHVSP